MRIIAHGLSAIELLDHGSIRVVLYGDFICIQYRSIIGKKIIKTAREEFTGPGDPSSVIKAVAGPADDGRYHRGMTGYTPPSQRGRQYSFVQIQIGILNMSSMLPHIQSGRLRALAVTSGNRSTYAPHVPSVAETVAGFDSVEWFAFIAPAGVADAIIARLHAAIVKAARTPQFEERAKQMGVDLVLNSPAEFGAIIAADIARFADLVERANIRLD